MPRNRGFSVVELLIAIAIMAIGATLAAPLFTELLESSRLTTTTNNVVEALATARSEAIRRHTAVEVVPAEGTDWRTGWIVRLSADQTELKRFDAVPARISITASSSLTSVEYQRSGTRTLPAVAVTLDICGSGEKGRQVSIALSGGTSINSSYTGC